MSKSGGVRMRVIPLLLIAVGTLFLLANVGVMPTAAVREFFATWWPLLPIGVGIAALSGRHGRCRMLQVLNADDSA